jgi:hypothetical protein
MYKVCVYDTGKLENYSILATNMQKEIRRNTVRSIYICYVPDWHLQLSEVVFRRTIVRIFELTQQNELP